MDRLSPIRVILPLLLIGLASQAMSADERKSSDMQRGPTTNPHGPSLKTPCGSCHTSTSWSPIRAIPEFDHNRETKFPLRGMHEKVQCGLCHTKLVFTNVGSQCADCHADIHRAQFGAKCDECHNVKGWQDGIKSAREHSARFPLIGAHASVTCDACHVSAAVGRFVGLSTQCASCHINEFNTAASVNHKAAGFSVNCETCHNMTSWLGVVFDHSTTGFVLAGAHATLACAACHVGGQFKGTPADCFSCHVKDFNATNNPPHAAAGFSKDCSTCHNMVNWNNATFNHNLTPFPLTGAHITVACNACHINGNFTTASTSCFSCHATTFNTTTNPNHVTAGFQTDCSQCHNTTNWQNAKFDHSTSKFPLTGAHITVACTACHIGGQFATAPLVCSGCHLADFQKTNSPNHVAAGYPQDCTVCHTTTAWQPASFDHSKTGFALTGAHTTVQCQLCHISNNFATTPTQCSGCHLPDYQKTNAPNHAATGIPTTCEACHVTAAWTPASFDHSKTVFPLTGAHVQVQCTLCHVNGNYTTVPTQCSGCHIPDFNKTTNPNHVTAGFPQDCSLCHTTAVWTPSTFDHSKTAFPLTGSHVTTACALCHVNNNFKTLPMNCVGCHLIDFQKTTNPNHVTGGFSQDCQVCHSTTNWLNATFDHSKTSFPLTGAHISVQCALCHINNNFTTVPTQCSGCHMTDFNKTASPPHVSAGFPTDCTLCHTTANWTSATFNHSTTGFPLDGGHTSLLCAQCHVNNNYKLTSGACYPCHTADFTATNNPPHASAGFPTDCTLCHTTANWTSATFNHGTTGFPLTGGHTSLLCAQCHVSNNYKLTSGACYPCHTVDYTNTNNPPHASAGFPTDCTLCHTTANWTSATFNHSTTGFPLDGGHVSLQCAQCHVSNNYKLTSGACYPCHTADYNDTNNPPHASAGFPTDCTLCHTTANWTSATFNHSTTGFPLDGGHVSLLCAQCHVSNNYKLTSGACYPCHTTDYNGATNPPHAASGFPTDCTQCHTTANWTSSTFNHNNTGFALTGAHTSLHCAQCHVDNNYKLTSGACYPCHTADFTWDHQSASRLRGFPDRLHAVPLYDQLDQRNVQSRDDRIHAGREACDRDVRAVPRQ